MRIIRPILLCSLVAGIALTLALGPSALSPVPAGAQTGYGDGGPTGPVPPRSLFIGAVEAAALNPLLIAVLVAAALAAGVVLLIRRRRSGS